MNLTIATGSRLERLTDIQYFEVATTLGVMGVLPHHADFAGVLPGGKFRIVTAAGERQGWLAGGFLRIAGGEEISLWVQGYGWEAEPAPGAIPDLAAGGEEFSQRLRSRWARWHPASS